MNFSKIFLKPVIIFAIILFAFSSNHVFSQNAATISRVAVTLEDSKTNIWISDFPKNVSVMLIDEDDNLLGVITTNKFGAAFTKINKPVATTIIAKTLNGEVNVTNKAFISTTGSKEDLAINTTKNNIKA